MMTEIAIRNLELRAYTQSGSGRSWTDPQYFEIETEQTNRRRPNKATIMVRNLSSATISWLEQQAELIEVLSTESLLFRGDVRKVESTAKGEIVETTITCGDGGSVYRTARLSRSYSPGVTSTRILADLGAVAGLPVVVRGELPELVFESGYAIAGKIVEEMHDLVESLGAESSVQNQQFEIIAANAPRRGGVLLSGDTGLVGSPTRKKKIVTCECKLYPQLRPGAYVNIDSRFISGWHRVVKSRHKASSDGEKWTTEIEAKKL